MGVTVGVLVAVGLRVDVSVGVGVNVLVAVGEGVMVEWMMVVFWGVGVAVSVTTDRMKYADVPGAS